MEIRKRLTYQFSAAVALILLVNFFAIFLSFAKSRKVEFSDRLASKSKLVAQMLIDIDEINVDVLKKIEENNPLNLANEINLIFDSRKNKIYSSDSQGNLNISQEIIRETLDNGEVFFFQNGYEVYGLHYKSKGIQIIVFTAAIDIFGFRKIRMLQIILIAVYFISLIFVLFIGRLLANRALRPIGNIINQVDEISISNLYERVNEGNGKDEIAKLAITFNNMLERLDSSFSIQKIFIANASHELRNPLTVLTGQIEVVLMSDRRKQEYVNTLLSVYEDAKNINRLADNLLLLAQTNMDNASFSFTDIRVDDILWQSINEMKNRFTNLKIRTSFGDMIHDDDNLTIPGNELLIRTAFINILENAYKYSKDPVVQVIINLNMDHIVIEFKDNGIGIPPEDISLVCNPFFRSKNAIKIKGHGIGLTLVENITHLHSGFLSVSSEVNKGSNFILHFPKSIKRRNRKSL
jgi:signal transduction histidine kinase